MSEATAPAPQPTAAPAPELSGSVEDRANVLFSTTGNDNAIANDNAASPAASPSDDQRAQERAARRAKLDELREKSRSAVDFKQAQREREDLRKQNEQLMAQLAQRVDLSSMDPPALLAALEKAKVPASAVREWIVKTTERPELDTIRKEVDPQIAELRKQNAELQARVEEFLQTQQTSAQQVEAQRAAQAFSGFVSQNAATSPLSARFLEKHGQDEFIILAEAAAKALPPNAGAQALLDEIEENLTQLGSIYSAAPAATQRSQAPQFRTNPAAAQAPTHISNSLAQQRSSVVDEAAALENMSLEERAALIFR